MQNFKKNWLVSSKLTWEIWRVLTRVLKNLPYNGLLLNKVYNVWANKSIWELCLLALNIDATFEGKLTCAFKNDLRNLANFHQTMFGSLKIGTLMGSFYTKQKIYELKIYRGVLCHDSEEWCKIWRGIDLSLQNWHEEFYKFWPKHSKISKNWTLIGCFWPKYIMLELKKVQRIYVEENLKENWLKNRFHFRK